MIFKTERLLIKIAAILGIVGIFIVATLFIMMYYMKDTEMMRQAMEASGQELRTNYFTTGYFITTLISILLVASLFVINNKLDIDNYKTMGIILILLGIASYWLLWFAPTILIIVAGVMVLTNKQKKQEESNSYYDE